MSKDRRFYPRRPLVMPVAIRLNSRDQDLEFECESVNLSRKGMEISCNDRLIDAILAQDEYPHVCELQCTFPDRSRPCKLKSQVVTHRRESQHHYKLVLRFMELTESDREVIEQELTGFHWLRLDGPGNPVSAGHSAG